jgi:hypothetical protein
VWSTEHSVTTSAAPERIWQLWADVSRWAEWNGDIEQVELVGPFAAGSRIVMTPIGQEPIELRIAEAAEPELFVDEADLGDIVVRTTHRVQRIDGERLQRSPTGWKSPARKQTCSGRRSGPRSAPTSRRRLQHWPSAPRADSRRRANEV